MKSMRDIFCIKDKKVIMYLVMLLASGIFLQLMGGKQLSKLSSSGGVETFIGGDTANADTANTSGTATQTGRNTSEGSAATNTESELYIYERQLEQRLEEALSLVENAGKVKVLVSLASNKQTIYATDSNTSENYTQETDSQGGSRETSAATSQEKTIIITGRTGEDHPLIVAEIEPKIAGVIIIAAGGDNVFVKDALTKAACTLLGIDVNKVQVLKMRED